MRLAILKAYIFAVSTEENAHCSSFWYSCHVALNWNKHDQLRCADTSLGVTPFVDPDDLKFFFNEIHRLTK